MSVPFGQLGRYLFNFAVNPMPKVLIFGNSGSGKSTLAKSLAESDGLAHFDLDTIAWSPASPPKRMPVMESAKHINHFLAANSDWVVEGCYADLIEIASHQATEMIFLNLSVEDCIANARNRPWEPHKYQSVELQNENLEMLLEWIRAYAIRNDSCSQVVHEKLYNAFKGSKKIVTENE